MADLKFKTNIKCNACVAKVSPVLNQAIGEGSWEVDLKAPQRILTITSETEPEEIIALLNGVGYQAEPIV